MESMESFETILSAGGHMNSLGRSKEVYEIVKANTGRMSELFDCIYADDAWIRMRAIDTFEKLASENPELSQPYTELLIEDLTKKNQPSIQWHLAQLFAEIELNQSQTVKALLWLKDKISTTDVDWIVSVNVMKTLVYFYDKKLIGADELVPLFNLQTTHKSKTVRKKAQLFINKLQKHQK